MGHVARTSFIALLLLVAACSATEPKRKGTEYVLRTVDGTPLPHTNDALESVVIVTIADTIVLREDGSGLRLSTRDTYLTDYPPVRLRESTPITFTVTGEVFEATLPTGTPGSGPFPGPHLLGTLVGDELRIDDDVSWPTPLYYERFVR